MTTPFEIIMRRHLWDLEDSAHRPLCPNCLAPLTVRRGLFLDGPDEVAAMTTCLKCKLNGPSVAVSSADRALSIAGQKATLAAKQTWNRFIQRTYALAHGTVPRELSKEEDSSCSND